ncbi:MAG: DNA primase [Desulfovibrionaceae bacterium]|nr:DNA primase [Desulfovibrionaceae bacterium]
MSNRSDIEAIKSRLNLVDIAKRYLELRRAGGRWVAPCPFHNETKPSFSINEEDGLFYCFGCQASGDLIDFYCRINGLEFREGLVQLAEEAGVELARAPFNPKAAEADDFKRQALKLHELAMKRFTANLRSQAGAAAREYIARRQISPEMVEAFGLGYSLNEWGDLVACFRANGARDELGVKAGLLARSERGGRVYDRFRGRLMFPIRNLSGRVIAFGGRIIENADDQAKYINSSDSPIYKKGEHLYGLYQARRSISHQKSAMLTEGYLDVITLHQFGYTNACGVLGTALTKEQVQRLAGLSSCVELLFDGDNAGRKAALRSAEMILAAGLNCRVVILPEGEDIDSLLHSPDGQGREVFENLRKKSEDGLDYCAGAVKTTMSPREMVDWFKNFIAQVEIPELINNFISRLAPVLGIDEVQIRGQIQKRVFKNQAGEGTPRSTSGKGAQPVVGRADEAVAREILHFIACFPGYVEQLHAAGCEKLLLTPFSRAIWNKLLKFGETEVFEHFAPEEKAFWVRCRVADPLPEANRDQLFVDIRARIKSKAEKELAQTYKDVLRRLGPDQNAGLEILRALTEAQRNSNGEH